MVSEILFFGGEAFMADAGFEKEKEYPHSDFAAVSGSGLLAFSGARGGEPATEIKEIERIFRAVEAAIDGENELFAGPARALVKKLLKKR